MHARVGVAVSAVIVVAMAVGACAADREGQSESRARDAATASTSRARHTETSQPPSSLTTTTTTTTVAVTTSVPPPVTSASAADGNLMVEASLADGTVSPSEFVEFAVHVEDGDADKVRVVWDFGDGTQTPSLGEPAVCATQPAPRRVDAVDRQRHAYRHPGRYRAVLHVVTGPQQCLSEPATEQVSLELEVHVSAGVIYSNGPEAADVHFGQDRDTEDGSVAMFASALEYDGYLVRAVINWGDGSRPDTFERTTQGCNDPDRSWPVSIWAPSPLVHRYDHEGAFTVTITFVSTGCDGRDEQSTSTTAEAHSRRDAPPE